MSGIDVNHDPRAAEQHGVDEQNARVYGHFPFPWECLRFDDCVDPMLDTITLAADDALALRPAGVSSAAPCA